MIRHSTVIDHRFKFYPVVISLLICAPAFFSADPEGLVKAKPTGNSVDMLRCGPLDGIALSFFPLFYPGWVLPQLPKDMQGRELNLTLERFEELKSALGDE